jgi:hypothetical protein
MTTQTNTRNESIDFALGQIQALIAFATAVAKTHENAGDLAVQFAKAEHVGRSRLESSHTLDPMLNGFQDLSQQLRITLERAAAVQESDNAR